MEQTEKKPLQIGVSSKNNNIPVWKIIRKQILERTGLAEDMWFQDHFPHYEAGMLIIVKTRNTIEFI